MTDSREPPKGGLTPPDYDEYGDVPDSGAGPAEDEDEAPEEEGNPGESPLG